MNNDMKKKKISEKHNKKVSKDLVHVWMVTYNHERFIGKAIESVLKQKTDFKYKLIIGEDCSTDNTRKIVEFYAASHPNIIEANFNEKNIGVAKNSIKIYKKCTAKYVALLEGDDYWIDNSKLQRQVDYLETHPRLSMCFTDSYVIDEKDNIIKEHRVGPAYRRQITQKDILSGFCPPANTVLFRNDYLKEILKNLPNIFNGDYYISALMTNYGFAGYINFISAAYRMHGNGLWAKKNRSYLDMNFVKVAKELENKVLPQNKKIVTTNIDGVCNRLAQENQNDQFLENNMWTPQTAMLRSIRDIIICAEGHPKSALSIDNNPQIEKILLRKWPHLHMQIAKWPEIDAQNLEMFETENFDIVFSHQVLEHIPKPWIAAKEMNRVLKKRGLAIHTTCAFNPKHGLPDFNDYYRFLPDGLEQLFDGIRTIKKEGWGSRQALIYNLTIDDGFGELGGRRFCEYLGRKSEENYPWHTWIIYQKL